MSSDDDQGSWLQNPMVPGCACSVLPNPFCYFNRPVAPALFFPNATKSHGACFAADKRPARIDRIGLFRG